MNQLMDINIHEAEVIDNYYYECSTSYRKHLGALAQMRPEDNKLSQLAVYLTKQT
uniref:Transposase n=1 Tax=Heterorhabditis bacteriophora TaxID=37862 RepID=A0A1I7WWE3_HETBA